MFPINTSVKQEKEISDIGEYVLVRSFNDGINVGKLVYMEGDLCVLEGARSVGYLSGAKMLTASVEWICNHGARDRDRDRDREKEKDAKEIHLLALSEEVSRKYIKGYYVVIRCSDKAKRSLQKAPVYKQDNQDNGLYVNNP